MTQKERDVIRTECKAPGELKFSNKEVLDLLDALDDAENAGYYAACMNSVANGTCKISEVMADRDRWKVRAEALERAWDTILNMVRNYVGDPLVPKTGRSRPAAVVVYHTNTYYHIRREASRV